MRDAVTDNVTFVAIFHNSLHTPDSSFVPRVSTSEIALAVNVSIFPKPLQNVYTHDIEELTEIAGLMDGINAALLESLRPPHIDGWLIIKDWNINLRYHVPDAFPQAVAESAVSAIDAMGLVQWLLK